jgi:hypothetical protein
MTNPPPPPSPSPAPARRSRLVSALMILVGILMLLPGLCSIVGVAIFPGSAKDPAMIAIWAVCGAVSLAGILLLRRASRG